ncbi:MAG: tetratricopeptide repeat protein [Candidatus Ozemobacteraceae bacterium]
MRISHLFFTGFLFVAGLIVFPGSCYSSSLEEFPQNATESPLLAEPSPDDQIESLRQAQEKNPKDPGLRTNLANFLLKKATNRQLSISEREIFFQEAADLVPDDGRIQHLWGDAFFGQKNFEAAFTHFEAALNVQPENLDCLMKAGISLQNFLKFEEAIAFFERARKITPKAVYLLYLLGRCYAETKDHEKAIETWEEATTYSKIPQEIEILQKMIARSREQIASTTGGTQEENQRFIIHYAGDSQKDIGEITADVLESAYDQVTGDLLFHPDVKVHVIFYLTNDFYSVNQANQWVGALAQGIKILVPLKQGYADSTSIKGTFAHELTHVLINLKTGNHCPTWIHEGVAMFSEFKAMNGDPNSMSPYFEQLLEKRIKNEKVLIPLSAIDIRADRPDTNDSIGLQYLHCYLAIRFLIDRWGTQALDELLTSLGNGSHLDNAIEDATGRPPSQFQTELFDWMMLL